MLGVVKWYGPWRRYTFHPTAMTLFDASCLSEIAGFLVAAMDDRRRRRVKR